MEVVRLYTGASNFYVSRHGRSPCAEPMIERPHVRIEAGQGIVIDRCHEDDPANEREVTFFSEEIWLRLQEALEDHLTDPGVLCRNIIVRGADLFSLIGRPFEVQSIRFKGSGYCKPGIWMDRAFAPGALRLLSEWRGGGLRARALSGGLLVCDAGIRNH